MIFHAQGSLRVGAHEHMQWMKAILNDVPFIKANIHFPNELTLNTPI